jgi:hypothetical protein
MKKLWSKSLFVSQSLTNSFSAWMVTFVKRVLERKVELDRKRQLGRPLTDATVRRQYGESMGPRVTVAAQMISLEENIRNTARSTWLKSVKELSDLLLPSVDHASRIQTTSTADTSVLLGADFRKRIRSLFSTARHHTVGGSQKRDVEEYIFLKDHSFLDKKLLAVVRSLARAAEIMKTLKQDNDSTKQPHFVIDGREEMHEKLSRDEYGELLSRGRIDSEEAEASTSESSITNSSVDQSALLGRQNSPRH